MEELEIIMSKLETIEKRLDKLENKGAEEKREIKNNGRHTVDPKEMRSGEFAYVGKYNSDDGSYGSTFGADVVDINRLLSQSSFEMAKVIDAFANEDRIDMIKLLMHKKLSPKELMEELKFPTTGKLYHHISFLEKIGLITKDEDKYYITPKCVSAVVLILTGSQKLVRNDYF